MLLKIYQLPFIDRLICVLSGFMLTIIAIYAIIGIPEKKLEYILILFAILIYDVYVYFLVFRTYLCLDTLKRKLIIREFPGIKKEEIDISNLIQIIFVDGKPEKYKKFFSIEIICRGFVKKNKFVVYRT